MNLKQIEQKEIFPGLKGKFIHGDKISWAFWDVKKNCIVPNHSHIHEQIMHVVSGKFEFTLDGNSNIYSDGDVVVIPSNILHSGKALTNCELMDVFSPVRLDYK
jgi:quercetin dioxygenase-like cupin family protein|tara:strand:+ start:521 stop:832 length:312 start_codon:yes stop_codon:yes gene_type:complete